MFNIIARYLLLIVTLLALAACNAPPGSEAVAEPAATVSPEPWPTIRPTATREPTPTAAPTATTSEETPGSGTPSLTEEQYHHGKLGVTWTRPDNTWQFRDQVPTPPNPEIQPMVMLQAEDGQRSVLLYLFDIPPALSRMAYKLFHSNRAKFLAGFSVTSGIPVDELRVTEVSGFPAVLGQHAGTIAWEVLRPNGILLIKANGFETLDDVQPLLAGLELVDVPD